MSKTHTSVPLVMEYEDAAKRLLEDIPLTEQDVDDILDYLCAVAQRHQIFYLWRPFLKDPKDDMVLELAVSQEYAKLHQTFGWDTKDFFHCNRNALKAAFVPDDVRNKLLARLADGYQHGF